MRRLPTWALLLVASWLLASAAPIAAAEPAPCAGLLSTGTASYRTNRLVRPDDLARLRDLGSADSSAAALSGASISPDGRHIALQLRRADPASNSYCLAVIVLETSPGAAPVIVDEGGEFISLTASRRGLAKQGIGLPQIVVPRWSPDGRRLAFLRRDNGSTQVWLVRADGSSVAERITHLGTDVEDVRWLRGGGELVLATRPGLAIQAAAVDQEALTGFHYDQRISPLAGNRPEPFEPVPREYLVVHAATGGERAARPEERAVLEQGDGGAHAEDGRFGAATPDGARVWVSPRYPDRFAGPDRLHRVVGGVERRCDSSACDHIVGLWWSPNGSELWFLARAGWGGSQLAFYRWPRWAGEPARAWTIEHLLVGCQPLGSALMCAEERAEQPRRLVLVDPASGASRPLYDPNPEFSEFRLGAVRRLRWRNAFGIESFGDLVLPPDYRRGRRLPLVVVQYRSKGFLRGGVGDEAPIQALAARGYAVLSFERPNDIAALKPLRSEADLDRRDFAGWADRRSVQSSLERGVRLVVSMGVADPDKVGITGLSDGAATVQWALINSDIFRAAAISSCEDESAAVVGGPVLAAMYKERGLPIIGDAARAFWRPYSLAASAAKVRAPILLQTADREYLAALSAVTALRAAGRPVDMFVFPDEYHIKWQPAHRLAVYNRVIDWFDFWLRGTEDPDPSKQDEYARWHAMRASPIAERSQVSQLRRASQVRAHASASARMSSRR